MSSRIPSELLNAEPAELARRVKRRELTALQAARIAVAHGNTLIGTAVLPQEQHTTRTPLTHHAKKIWRNIPKADGSPARDVVRTTSDPEAGILTCIFGDYNTRFQRHKLEDPLTPTASAESTTGWRYDPRTGLYTRYVEEDLMAAIEEDRLDDVLGYLSIVPRTDDMEELTHPDFYEPGHYVAPHDLSTLASIPVIGRSVLRLGIQPYADMPALPERPMVAA
ncbi:MAG TPA: hypothetical protein VD735_00135 [Candidatus Saccharimonadales bacterium]|nr:hypothetical protein [Candidatus Saccharimonadales bacterium]